MKQVTAFFIIAILFTSISVPVGAAEEAAALTATPSRLAPADTNITLDFKEADINTVLRVMSLKSKVNIVAGPEVQGNVTIRLENVPWEKALDVVLRTYGYVYERDGNIIRVTTRENLAAEPVVTQTYILNYTKAAEVLTAVQDMLTERGRIKTSDRTNTLVITDIPTNLYTVGEIIKRLDKVTPQAFIDSKVIKTDVGSAENIGIQWNTGGATGNLGSISGSSRPTIFPFSQGTQDGDENISPLIEQFFPATGGSTTAIQNSSSPRSFPLDLSELNPAFATGTLSFASFNAVMQLLKQRSNTKIVSNPRIVVLNNQTAKVQVGQQIPLPTFERNSNTGTVEVTGYSYRDVGVILNVTPHINAAEEILVDLKPEVSATNGTTDFGEFQVPNFDVTQAVTQVLIKTGETIAIGGLMTDNTATSEQRVPYFSDVPLVGKLFRSKRQTAGSGNAKVETLFFVTVTMVDTEGQPTGEESGNGQQSGAAGAAATGADTVTKEQDEPGNAGSDTTGKEAGVKKAAAEKAAA